MHRGKLMSLFNIDSKIYLSSMYGTRANVIGNIILLNYGSILKSVVEGNNSSRPDQLETELVVIIISSLNRILLKSVQHPSPHLVSIDECEVEGVLLAGS